MPDRARARKIVKANIAALTLTFLILLSCKPYGHWGSYGWWRDNCLDFPSREEVEQVFEEHKELIERLVEERLVYKANVTPCPDGAFITLYSKNKAAALAKLDEVDARAEGLTMFYGVPFRFTRD